MRKQFTSILPYIIIGIGIAVFYYVRYRMPPQLEFAELKAMNEDGREVVIGDLIEGKSVVHFYASWCGPCIREMSEIKQNFDQLQAGNIQFIFITDDPEEKVKPFNEMMPAEITFLRISSLQDIGIHTLPTTYITNDKILTGKHVDALHWNNIQEVNSRFEKK